MINRRSRVVRTRALSIDESIENNLKQGLFSFGMRDVLDKIIATITPSKERVLYLEGKRIVPSDAILIEERSREQITAIDGGSTPIFESPSMAILFARIVSLTMNEESKSIKKKEGFLVAESKIQDTLKVVVTFHPLQGESEIVIDAKAEEFGDEVPSLFSALNLARKLLEWQEIKCATGTVVWDGALTIHNTIEEKAREQLPQEFIALAKTTQVLGNYGAFFKETPEQPWYLCAFDNTYFVRLHKKSKRVFRADTPSPDTLASLVPWSCDGTFLGYPYPLILVDQLARVSRDEGSALRARFQAAAGKRWKDISAGEETRDAHTVLDSLQF